jgi:hypothetical protein
MTDAQARTKLEVEYNIRIKKSLPHGMNACFLDAMITVLSCLNVQICTLDCRCISNNLNNRNLVGVVRQCCNMAPENDRVGVSMAQ